jgi:hypothetical protein
MITALDRDELSDIIKEVLEAHASYCLDNAAEVEVLQFCLVDAIEAAIEEKNS